YRGTPAGIDVRRVADTGITPVMDVGIAGRAGGQIGAGCFRAPIEPFLDALQALTSSRRDADTVPA
ncbi:MAG: YahG/YlbE-like protein, partial [Modestobacter sp.]|nr:YahG/YlbE-like protein [Modestobacter sp.]